MTNLQLKSGYPMHGALSVLQQVTALCFYHAIKNIEIEKANIFIKSKCRW